MNKNALVRQSKHRMKIIHHYLNVSSNASATCRYYGISRQVFYKWLNRYRKLGDSGLYDLTKRPHKSPKKTSSDIVSRLLYLRVNYHFGAGKISNYLKRYHNIEIAASTVHKILTDHGMSLLPVNKLKYERSKTKWKRYEKQQPGQRVQIDVKFLERIAGTSKRLYQYTAIDDCTRIRVLKIYDRCNQKTSIQFAQEVKKRLPPCVRIFSIQTDNGSEFQSDFHWYLEDNDIKHIYIKPRTPRLNGKVERSHRIDNQEFYQLLDKNMIADDIHLYNKELKNWEDYYNFNRPHGALDGQTPYERLKLRSENQKSLAV
jgi:transposase InsO family protein